MKLLAWTVFKTPIAAFGFGICCLIQTSFNVLSSYSGTLLSICLLFTTEFTEFGKISSGHNTLKSWIVRYFTTKMINLKKLRIQF